MEGNQETQKLLKRVTRLEERVRSQEQMLKMTSLHLSEANRRLTDNIKTAQRVQESLMPSNKVLEDVFPGAFVLDIPRDKLSGDILWVRQIKGVRYAAVIDCTGHGVTGAMISVLAVSLLNQILSNTIGKLSPANILNELNNFFKRETQRAENRTQIRDGMDLALIAYNKEERRLDFAGARRPLYILRDQKIIPIKGSRVSLGEPYCPKMNNKIQNQTLKIEKGDWLYLFSDGYPDQFGSPSDCKMVSWRFRNLLINNQHTYGEGSKQKQGLQDYFEQWKGVRPQTDDVLVMGIPFTNSADLP